MIVSVSLVSVALNILRSFVWLNPVLGAVRVVYEVDIQPSAICLKPSILHGSIVTLTYPLSAGALRVGGGRGAAGENLATALYNNIHNNYHTARHSTNGSWIPKWEYEFSICIINVLDMWWERYGQQALAPCVAFAIWQWKKATFHALPRIP